MLVHAALLRRTASDRSDDDGVHTSARNPSAFMAGEPGWLVL